MSTLEAKSRGKEDRDFTRGKETFTTWADYENEEHPHLAQPTVGQPTVGDPGYKAHKAWADYEDEEAPRIPWDPVEDLNSQDSQDWSEVVHKSRSNASTNTSSTSSSHSGKIVNWYGKPIGFNTDGTSIRRIARNHTAG
jgi:hypothetical protein